MLRCHRSWAHSFFSYPSGSRALLYGKMASISAKAAAVYSTVENLKQFLPVSGTASAPTVTIESLVDVSERFGLWARNIGALHPPESKLSLDSRRQNAPEIQEWVSELLDDLTEALNDRKFEFKGSTTRMLLTN